MSDDLAKRAREVLNGVTPGPWVVGEDQCVDDTWSIVTTSCGAVLANVNDRPARTANAHFIAASRELVPVMADRIEELEAKLAKAVEDAEKYQYAFAAQSRKLQAVLHIEGVRTTLAEINGGGDT